MDPIESINRKIHPDDEMMKFIKFKGQTEQNYLNQGYQDAKCYLERISRWRPSIASGKRVLDFGCGHGRITRFLHKFLLPSHMVVADVWEGAVRFCADEFDGTPFVISDSNPISNVASRFDVIICNSVFSHLPPKSMASTMSELAETLDEDGLLLFTTKGENCPERTSLSVSLEDGFHFGRPEHLRPNETDGRLPGHDYSLMIVSKAFVEEILEEVGLRIVEHLETAIRFQDLYVVERSTD